MAVHILGIRHHGVGSAKQVGEQLDRIKPDIVLIEGPPEIQEVFKHVGSEELKPPVAIMVYDSNEPKNSTFYPFAEYSPEWVAIKYANDSNIPVKSLDLPATIAFTKEKQAREKTAEKEKAESDEKLFSGSVPFEDPMTVIASSQGFADGEQFWEHHFENGIGGNQEHFEAVLHLMSSLRSAGLKSSLDTENVEREAYMRAIISKVKNEMYETIAVVCGAWHAPALANLEAHAKEDQKILKKLPKPKVKTTTTWVPWTNGRLSMLSGYGAGILSPGWSEHLWTTNESSGIKWLTKVAGLFREKKVDISTAHVIEAYRLANSLSAMRGKHYLSLSEMNDAVLSVMLMGDDIQMELVRNELIVGDRLGEVPDDIPKMPLQEDFEQEIKKLRLKLSAAPKQYDLDLRKDLDRSRSVFFHRLQILEFPWMERVNTRTKGTFKESWTLQWSPEMMITLIDKAFLGNTIETAAQKVLSNEAETATHVNRIAELIQLTIPAELFEELDVLLTKINELSSVSSDILDLIKSVPQLVNVSRYGDVRKTDLIVLRVIIDQILVKIYVGLANACYGLDEENSIVMFEQISLLSHAIKIYADAQALDDWHETMFQILDKEGTHAVVDGCVCRLLLDAQQFTEVQADQRISLALSVSNDSQVVASWIEGFLKGSGMILIYDDRLWNLVFTWVESLQKETFVELLPLLRRAFSKFEYSERRQIGEKSKQGLLEGSASLLQYNENFDSELAETMIPVIAKFLNP